jgi:hypothetical protein
MKNLFKDILDTDGVKGVLLLSFDGVLIFKEYLSKDLKEPQDMNWKRFISSLDGVRETDLVFDTGRIYIRRSEVGYLLIPMEINASVAMIRLNCDILLPLLKPTKSSKRLKRLFKK